MTRDPAQAVKVWSLNHWTTREFPTLSFLTSLLSCGWGHCASLLLISQSPLSLSEHTLRRNARLPLSPLTFFKSFFFFLIQVINSFVSDSKKWQLNSFHVQGRISSLKLALRASQEPHYVSLIGTHSHFPRWLWQKASYFLKTFVPHSPFSVLAKTLAHLTSRN